VTEGRAGGVTDPPLALCGVRQAMAIIDAEWWEVRGKHEGVLGASWRRVAYMRSRARTCEGSHKTTARCRTWRNMARWYWRHYMTPEQQEPWRKWARTWRWLDRMEVPKWVTGCEWFCHVNVRRKMAGLPLIFEAPEVRTGIPCPGITAWFSDECTLWVQWPDPQPDPMLSVVLGYGPLDDGRMVEPDYQFWHHDTPRSRFVFLGLVDQTEPPPWRIDLGFDTPWQLKLCVTAMQVHLWMLYYNVWYLAYAHLH